MNKKLVIALAISSALTPFAASADTLDPSKHNLDYLYLNGKQVAPEENKSVFDKVLVSIGSVFGSEDEPAEAKIINDTNKEQVKAPIWKEVEPSKSANIAVKPQEPVKAKKPIKAEEPVKAQKPVKAQEPIKAEKPKQTVKATRLVESKPVQKVEPKKAERVVISKSSNEPVWHETAEANQAASVSDAPSKVSAQHLIAPGFFAKLDTQSLLFTTDIDDNEIFGTAELGIGAGYRFIIDSDSSSFVDIYATKNIGFAMDTKARTDLDGFGVGVMYGNKFDSYEKMHWTVDAEFVQKDIQDTTTNGMTLSYGVLYPVTPQFAVSTSMGVAMPFDEPTDLLSSVGFVSKLGITYTF